MENSQSSCLTFQDHVSVSGQAAGVSGGLAWAMACDLQVENVAVSEWRMVQRYASYETKAEA